MKQRRVSVFLFVSLSIFFFVICPLLAAPNDTSSATSYLDTAEALYAAGEFTAAAKMTATCLEFYPNFSDALYLSAVIKLRDQSETLSGIAMLESALSAGTWFRGNPDAASEALAGVFVRIGKLQEAIGILQPLAIRQPSEPRIILLLSRAYAKGSPDLAGKTAAGAVSRFPKLADGYLLSSLLAEARGNSESARSAVSEGLRELPDSLPLLLRWAALQEDAGLRLRAADDYIAKGGTDPQAAVIALEAGAKDAQKFLSLFQSWNGPADWDLTRRVALVIAQSADLATSFRATLDAFTGNRDLDRDADGFYEERWQYQSGALVGWIRDENQDGAPEFTVDFVSGRPDTLEIPRQDGGTLTLHYDIYPYIDTANQVDREGTHTYSLTPHTLGCILLDSSGRASNADEMDPSARFFVPSTSDILSAAFHVEEYAVGSSAPFRRMDLAAGQRLFMEEDFDGDGVIDHRVWYSSGKPVRGLRDLGGNGVFGVSEAYRDGRLESIRVDTDGDGKVDYSEQYGATTVKLWDYNEDGMWDGRELPGANGTIVRELSTALNGKFNLQITFKKDVIVSVRKDARNLQVTPDAQRGIVWIGTPRRTVAVDKNTKDGVVNLGGRDYLVFRFASTVYVEELQ